MISSEPSNETASGIYYKFECPFCEKVITTGTMNRKFLPENCPDCKSNMRYKREESENPVTLRKFLSIIGKSLILTPYDCYVYIIEDDPFFEETDRLVIFGKRNTLPSLECLEPYMDYEVVKFNENRDYNEIIDQGLWLREVQEDDEV